MTRFKVELLLLVAVASAAFCFAEVYAQARGAPGPSGRQRDAVRASAFRAATVYVTQEQRLLINSGRLMPVICAAGLIGVVVRRAARRGSSK